MIKKKNFSNFGVILDKVTKLQDKCKKKKFFSPVKMVSGHF